MKTSNKKSSAYTTVSRGVQQTPSGNYRVRKTTNGNTTQKTFTNKAKAIKYYNSL